MWGFSVWDVAVCWLVSSRFVYGARHTNNTVLSLFLDSNIDILSIHFYGPSGTCITKITDDNIFQWNAMPSSKIWWLRVTRSQRNDIETSSNNEKTHTTHKTFYMNYELPPFDWYRTYFGSASDVIFCYWKWYFHHTRQY